MTDRQPSPLMSVVRQTARRLVGLPDGAQPDVTRVPSRDRMEQVPRLPGRPTWYRRRRARVRWLSVVVAVALGFGLVRLLGGPNAADSPEANAEGEAARAPVAAEGPEQQIAPAREGSATHEVATTEKPSRVVRQVPDARAERSVEARRSESPVERAATEPPTPRTATSKPRGDTGNHAAARTDAQPKRGSSSVFDQPIAPPE